MASGARIFAILVGFAAAMMMVGCGPKYPKCGKDEDCHEGEFCVNEMCQMCRADNDCQAGQRCNEGRCDPIAGYCDDPSDCPQGQNCDNHRCVAQQQQTDITDLESAERNANRNVNGCQLEVVYFDYDSSTLSDAARGALERNANCMRTRGGRVHVTGYTDPRGTEEYNLALGDRRARAVLQYLGTLGVSDSNVSVSSMGEEMARGQEEESWARDRRVELTAQ